LVWASLRVFGARQPMFHDNPCSPSCILDPLYASSVSKLSITLLMVVVVQSRLLILGIFMLQLAGCSPQAFSSYHRCSSHIRILVFSHHVADHLLYQTIHIVTDDPAFGKHPRSRSSHSCICLIHGLSLLSSALSRHLVAIAIRLVQPSIYLWSLILLSYRLRHSITAATVPLSPLPSSQSLKLSSLSHPVAVLVVRYNHVTNRSIQASQELGP
jgi:hypothetical protein